MISIQNVVSQFNLQQHLPVVAVLVSEPTFYYFIHLCQARMLTRELLSIDRYLSIGSLRVSSLLSSACQVSWPKVRCCIQPLVCLSLVSLSQAHVPYGTSTDERAGCQADTPGPSRECSRRMVWCSTAHRLGPRVLTPGINDQ